MEYLGDGNLPSDIGTRYFKARRKFKKFLTDSKPQFLTIPIQIHRGMWGGKPLQPDNPLIPRLVTNFENTICVDLLPDASRQTSLKVAATEKVHGGKNRVLTINLSQIQNGQLYLLDQDSTLNLTTQRIWTILRVSSASTLLVRIGYALSEAKSISHFFSEVFTKPLGSTELMLLLGSAISLLPESRCKVGIVGADAPDENFIVFDVHEIGCHLINHQFFLNLKG